MRADERGYVLYYLFFGTILFRFIREIMDLV